jgi:predicted ester cyclase
MPNSNQGFSQRWFDEVWNNQREAAIDELRFPGGRAFGFPSPSSELSHEEFKEAYREFNRNFSNIHVTIDEEVVEGDHIACRWSATGTHTGDGLGFPATLKQVSFSGASFMHLRHGKLHDGWNFFDFTAVVQQLRAN